MTETDADRETIATLHRRVEELEAAIDSLKTAAILPVLKSRLGVTYNHSRCLWEFASPYGDVAGQFVDLDAAVDMAARWMASTSDRINRDPANQSAARAVKAKQE